MTQLPSSGWRPPAPTDLPNYTPAVQSALPSVQDLVHFDDSSRFVRAVHITEAPLTDRMIAADAAFYRVLLQILQDLQTPTFSERMQEHLLFAASTASRKGTLLCSGVFQTVMAPELQRLGFYHADHKRNPYTHSSILHSQSPHPAHADQPETQAYYENHLFEVLGADPDDGETPDLVSDAARTAVECDLGMTWVNGRASTNRDKAICLDGIDHLIQVVPFRYHTAEFVQVRKRMQKLAERKALNLRSLTILRVHVEDTRVFAAEQQARRKSGQPELSAAQAACRRQDLRDLEIAEERTRDASGAHIGDQVQQDDNAGLALLLG
jgi:hypothetical protein